MVIKVQNFKSRRRHVKGVNWGNKTNHSSDPHDRFGGNDVVHRSMRDYCYELDAEDGNDDTKMKMNYQKVMKKTIVSKMQKNVIEEVMMVVLQLLFLQVSTITKLFI